MTFWVMTSLNLVGSLKCIIGKCRGGVPVDVSPSMAVCSSIHVKGSQRNFKKPQETISEILYTIKPVLNATCT
jgi:hypothetical protein